MLESRGWSSIAGIIALSMLCVVATSPVLRAQDDKALRDELGKLVGGSQKSLVDSIAKAVSQHFQKRIAELNKALEQKDRQIAELKKQVEKLLLAAKATNKPAKADEPPRPTKAFLGVSHVDHERGAEVRTVHQGSPAATAGLQAKDIISAVNGKAVTSKSLTGVLTTLQPGTEIKLKIIRGGKDLELKAKLVDQEKFHAAQAARASRPAPTGHLFLGIEVIEAEGALVVDVVEKGYTGDVIGLAKGDAILQVNGKAVKKTEEIGEAVGKVKAGEKFTLLTKRGSETIKVSGIAASGRSGAKLVERAAVPQSPAEPKPATKKPAYLGIQVAEVDKGLLVEAVTADSAAAAYGLAKNDVIKKFNGKDITKLDQLEAALGKLHAGDKVTIVVLRGNVSKEFKDVVLGAQGEKVTAPKKSTPPPGKKGRLGINAQELAAEKLVIIKDLLEGGAGIKAGLKPGDVLVKVGDKAITNFDDLDAALKDLKVGDKVTIVVKRQDKDMEIEVTLGEQVGEGLGD